MSFATGSSATAPEINVTPLIDVLLVLLIVFMVIVPIAPRGLDSSVPQAKEPVVAPVTPVIVRLLEGATPGLLRYQLGEKELSYAELKPAMASLFAVRQDRTLFIEADRSLSYQQVAMVVSEAKLAGAGQVALSGPQAK